MSHPYLSVVLKQPQIEKVLDQGKQALSEGESLLKASTRGDKIPLAGVYSIPTPSENT
jgi:hypothetical protein